MKSIILGNSFFKDFYVLFYMYSDLNGNDLTHLCVVIGPIIFILFILNKMSITLELCLDRIFSFLEYTANHVYNPM